jgi:hypothetical protein
MPRPPRCSTDSEQAYRVDAIGTLQIIQMSSPPPPSATPTIGLTTN